MYKTLYFEIINPATNVSEHSQVTTTKILLGELDVAINPNYLTFIKKFGICITGLLYHLS